MVQIYEMSIHIITISLNLLDDLIKDKFSKSINTENIKSELIELINVN